MEALTSVRRTMNGERGTHPRTINPLNNTPFHDEELDYAKYILSMNLFLFPKEHNYRSIYDICGPTATKADIELYCTLQEILTWGLNE
jgi:hypothetical protein